MFKDNYRILILILSTACLSMMLANILTLNFTILCMTEEKYRWENFTIDLGIDIFEKVDFDPPRPPEEKPEVPEIPDTDFKIPGIELPGVPTPGFDLRTLNFARSNPSLFLKIMKKVVKEVSWRAAQRAGEALDPRNIDYSKFKDGFNFTDYDPNVVLRIKDYLLDKIRTSKDIYDQIDAEGKNITEYRNIRVEDIELTNITWNGQINGRIKILERPADHYYTNTERAILFSIVALGGLIFLFPLSMALRKLGCRKTFTIVGLISAIATALCPLAAYLGFVPLVVVRFLQGIGFAASFPVIGCVISNWAKISENGLFNSVFTGFIQLAPVITMPMSGLLCSSFLGWRAAYYIHAILTLLFIALWWFLYRDTPSEISPRKTPVKEFLTTSSVLAIWIATIGNMFAILFLVTFAPTFLKNGLKLKCIVATGFLAAFAFLGMFLVKILVGVYGEKVLSGAETPRVRLFNSIAFTGMAVFFILLGIFVSEETRTLSIVFLILSTILLGFNTGGFYKSAILLGRQHCNFVNFVIQAIMCLALLIIPFLVYGITSENTTGQWSTMFIIFAVILLLTHAAFAAFGQGTQAAFSRFNDDSNRLSTLSHQTEQTKPIIKEPRLSEVNTPENNA